MKTHLAADPLTPDLSRLLNALGLIAIGVVLLFGFYDQFVGGELPCPLCILERAGFVGVGVGLALNLKFGPRPSHYALAMLSAIAGDVVAVRQTLLHIVPGTGTFGAAFLGLHFYTWAALLFVVIVGGCALLLLFDRQFAPAPRVYRLGGLALLAFGLIALLALGNGVSTVLECGNGLCPDDPVSYLLIEGEPPAPAPAP
ncbi:disulfide bond formation protein B [Ancylobacter rudongensis]|uniref:Disulfide bond formation protein DsbB n=1 Tax=Ancylobacter rudongensis TaxID=177413 RepID=A0A1G4UDC6_9HYPH|nr:disulfide bond formation protein B [Ancylobacter rudongensis]SCW90955.1 Disulfide bond formation protein DsbB [Ancylobacter rudongensis]